ncbi:MAG: DUF2095 family protein [Promethearchaeia archaeon]
MKKLKKSEDSEKIVIKQENGLTISYDYEILKNQFPNLIKEIVDHRTKVVNIEAIDYNIREIEKPPNNIKNNNNSQELTNPGAIDFIRRCSTNEEAIEILDYLFKRNELSEADYNKYKKCIQEEGGLEKLINEHGGFKKPGYYFKKYYHVK